MIPGTKKRKADFTDMVMYVAIATKHSRLIVLLFTLALAGGLIFYIFSRPVYYSKSIIRYTAIGTGTPTLEGQLNGERASDRFSDDKFLKDFDAEHICLRVDKRLGDEVGAARAGKSGRKQVRATWTTDHNIELNVWCYIPSWVTKYPEIMLQEFQKEREEKAQQLYVAQSNKFTVIIEGLTQKLVEQQKQQNKLNADFDPERLKNDLEELAAVPRQLSSFRKRLQDWLQIRQKLQNPVYTVSERLAFYSSINYDVEGTTLLEVDPQTKERLPQNMRPSNGTVIVRQSQSRSDVDYVFELERNKLLLERTIKEQSATFRPGHPKMQMLYKQRDVLEKNLQEELLKADAKFVLHGRLLESKVRTLEEQEPLAKAKQKKYDEYLEVKSSNLQGQLPYGQMINNMQKAMSETVLGLSNERVALSFMAFDLPIRDEIPISPNRLKIVLMSLGLGLALAIGIPFLLEFMDQTVTNMEKMEETTNMRGLGLVPDFEDEIAEAYPLIFSDGVANPDFIENFRVIRTNLLSSAATTKFPQVIMVTSASPKEGKTVVASNLAMSFAHTGEKTLIIDANLRRGIQHHLFGSRSAPGLSNILVEKYDVEDACRPTTMENLHILPCGDQLEGDIEQLGSPQFVAAIEKLRKRYQRIIVDATPVLGLAETSVMQPAMDGVVLVIWTGQTPTRAVRTAIDILTDNHANFYGFVLNRLDLMATMNRFHYYYYTNHYYNRYQTLTRQPQS